MTYYMNPHSGHVQTESEWESECDDLYAEYGFDCFGTKIDYEVFCEKLWFELIEVSWNSKTQAWED